MRGVPSMEQVRQRNEQHNSRLPICSTPNEILSEILDHAVHADDDALATSMPECLAAVCRRFRSVAITTPSLWTNITFGVAWEDEPAFFHADASYLDRSRGCSLDVNINWDHRSEEEKEGKLFHDADDEADPERETHWIAQSSVERAIDLLKPHLARVRTFHLEVEVFSVHHTFIKAFSGHAVPRLEVLELLCTKLFAQGWRFDPSPLATPLALFNGQMPRLRHASFFGVHIDWDSTLLRDLRSLTFAHHAGEVQPSLRAFHAIMAASPLLAKLEILGSGVNVDPVEQLPPCTPAPRVERLALKWADAPFLETLFAFFPMANVRRLALSDCAGNAAAAHALLERVATRWPGLVELELERIFFSSEEHFASVLARLPALESLTLDHAGSARGVLAALARHSTPVVPRLRELHLLNGSDAEVSDVVCYIDHRAARGYAPLERASVVQPDFDSEDAEDVRVLLGPSGQPVGKVSCEEAGWQWKWNALSYGELTDKDSDEDYDAASSTDIDSAPWGSASEPGTPDLGDIPAPAASFHGKLIDMLAV
ncbi:hypothetical protein AURDEDRAFT_117891 [Auricularia subglabra TFB-10046 SS5]|uniref:Uncharacterized protein n=1 Tax=Auricularia subglabra (strain TFB-10046 / SS5) TaxID=717982 RepID=J0LAD8_AURST|nr:hypothetical protein AURDEDRAFT_117891 [Auricularia subglabra TFB-10046 SS5]